MENSVNLCKGFTAKGKLCPYRAKVNSEFCGYHRRNSLSPDENERRKIKTFLSKHLGGVLAFLGGAAIDPVASDIYDFFKERLKMEHLVPPIREISELEKISRAWQEHRSEANLLALIPHIKLGMTVDEIQELLGKGEEPTVPYTTPPSFVLRYLIGIARDRYAKLDVIFPMQLGVIGVVDKIDLRIWDIKYAWRALDLTQAKNKFLIETILPAYKGQYFAALLTLEDHISEIRELKSEIEEFITLSK